MTTARTVSRRYRARPRKEGRPARLQRPGGRQDGVWWIHHRFAAECLCRKSSTRPVRVVMELIKDLPRSWPREARSCRFAFLIEEWGVRRLRAELVARLGHELALQAETCAVPRTQTISV